MNDLCTENEGLILFFCPQVEPFRKLLLADMQENLERFSDVGFAIAAVTYNEVEERDTN
ncbi:MAG: hypothetical protein F4039_09530 [Gammaproteobacteria bacterium]|nr:hypothetical protein [Gammaproteobacteria bacterium]MYF53017.1 hypothetical protein [Gammaproteobacteria bacterium]MYK44312.1 hypothetical protein [Gammaproteobacteria bacterium]